ncbi:hypothetical protein AOL_s00210g194 [Orbilia oligospora ATCC 24927]|uniref:Uncharacterized protein n=1 Tax=Arthrobotrys oligospora (strain ATCC 24927 / CBS 115.81 / DSM 1491) TaxID=756982 RepID=G1XS36_ARTOA|nr:hypothetical protein AOL_s00210g194 [Orbilia oligospora ATCC 24927]EGX44033.1 hypothetical protein AOL_s00210g194 [Orbilia oligospora ATCC 24927]
MPTMRPRFDPLDDIPMWTCVPEFGVQTIYLDFPPDHPQYPHRDEPPSPSPSLPSILSESSSFGMNLADENGFSTVTSLNQRIRDIHSLDHNQTEDPGPTGDQKVVSSSSRDSNTTLRKLNARGGAKLGPAFQRCTTCGNKIRTPERPSQKTISRNQGSSKVRTKQHRESNWKKQVTKLPTRILKTRKGCPGTSHRPAVAD